MRSISIIFITNKINYGIKTGFNDAFIIDNETKKRLVSENANSADIIKPILRGQDIQRYHANWAGMWLIDSHNGYNDVPPINIELYPAIKNHLNDSYSYLVKRQDKGITAYNLRNCAYYAEFEKDKVVWTAVNSEYRLTVLSKEYTLNNSLFMMAMTRNSIFICAFLNSLVGRKYLEYILSSEDDYSYGSKEIFGSILIPTISKIDQSIVGLIEDTVKKILIKKTRGEKTYELEKDIDKIFYTIFNFNDAEKNYIESNYTKATT